MSRRQIIHACIIVALGALLLGGMALTPVACLWLSFGRIMSERERMVFSLPDGVHAIEHSRIRINPLVAEYSRDVTYIINGVRGKTTPLQIDTCGGYPINCYWIETPRGPMLRLDDAVSEHLLDISNQTTYAVARVVGTTWVGELVDEDASPRWFIINNDPSTLSVTIGEAKAKPMADLIENAQGVYIGRIDGRHFVPAAESPEIAIRHLGPR